MSRSPLTLTDRYNTDRVQPPFSWRLVAILFVLALFPRLIAVALMPGGGLEGHTSDAQVYWQLADYWLETGVYGGVQGDSPRRGIPDAYLPPLYPALLAGTALLTGHSLVAVSVVQAILGALACVFVFYVSALVHTDRRVAWLAFVANAFYVVFLLWVTYHLTETLYIFFLTALILCLVLMLKRYQVRYALLAGGVFALTLLAREALVLWFPFLLVFWLVDRFEGRKKWVALGSFLLAALLVFTPWWVRNATVLDRMVFLTGRMDRSVGDLLQFVTPFSLSAENTKQGTIPTGDHSDLATCNATAVYGAILERNVPAGMERSPAETCCKYRAIFRDKVSLGETLSLSTACFVETWLHPNGLWSVPPGILRVLYLVAHTGLMATGLAGVIISLKRRLAWPMILLLVYGTISHVLRGALPRYVLPYMPFVLVFAAYALVLGRDALRKRRQYALVHKLADSPGNDVV